MISTEYGDAGKITYTNTKNSPTSKADATKHYCFIRLYQTEYKRFLTTGNILATVNKFISNPGKNKKKYTHAALNYQLNDNFVGLNMGGGQEDIRVETLRTMATAPNHPQDRDNSKFDMFCLRLTSEEYADLKRNLIKIKYNNNIVYDFKDLIFMSKDLILEKIKNKLSIGKEEKEDLSTTQMALVCSTFVAWILSKVSKKYATYFQMQNKSIYHITPNDLTYMPGMKYMYGGGWKEYSTLTRKYVNEHPEFKEYL